MARLDPKHYLKYSQIQMGVAAELIAQMDLQGKERLLDVGSGDGKITAFLRELVADVEGVDLCENMVHFASQLFPHIRFTRQNAEEMIFDKPFDVITCLSALHWVRRPVKAFKKMANALKPGGRAYILTYPVESMYWGPMYKAAQDPLFAPYLPSLATAYPAAHYCEAAQQAGLEVISSALQDHFATHDTLENIKSYIHAWLPNLIDLPDDELKSRFIDLAISYHRAQAVDLGDHKIHLPYKTLVLILKKPGHS